MMLVETNKLGKRGVVFTTDAYIVLLVKFKFGSLKKRMD